MTLILALFSLLAYLIGSLPVSYWVGKLRGIDIRTVGSGNVGATNVARSVGLPFGLLALLIDVAKGAVPGLLSVAWSLPIWTAAFAVVGHNWSLFLRFRGGKGVATTLGLLLAISWPVMLATTGIWALIAATSRYVSVASVSALLVAPPLLLLGGEPPEPVVLIAVLAVLSAFRHRENFFQLFRGQERRL